jgi:hypothetical protein
MSSFKKINYSLRPAKATERRMLNFALKKLSHFDHLSNYQYVGFGSTTFHDFILFHKELGINQMISIESSENENRFNFNKPFSCIKMMFGNSQKVLPKINWEKKSILWLDYDKQVRDYYLSDIDTFITSATSASCILITLNCDPDAYGDTNEKRRDYIINQIGEKNLHFGNKLIDFASNNLPQTLYKILTARIKSTLSARNGILSKEDKLNFEQIFHFNYSDGAKMLTFGGILLTETDKEIFDNYKVGEYNFLSSNESTFNIEIPILTMKEVRFLNSQMPDGIDDEGNIVDDSLKGNFNPNLTATEVLKFASIYRFFPHYTEAFSI